MGKPCRRRSITTPAHDVTGSIFGERVPRYENHVRINQHVTDAWGIPVLHVEVRESDNEFNMARDAANTIEELFHAAGWDIISKTDKFYPPGYSRERQSSEYVRSGVGVSLPVVPLARLE